MMPCSSDQNALSSSKGRRRAAVRNSAIIFALPSPPLSSVVHVLIVAPCSGCETCASFSPSCLLFTPLPRSGRRFVPRMSFRSDILVQRVGMIDQARSHPTSASASRAGPLILIISRQAWQSLSREDRNLLRDVAKGSSKVQHTLMDEYEAGCRSQATSLGVRITEDVDRSAFRNARVPQYPLAVPDQRLDWVKRLVDARDLTTPN
jgi:hypothetical protein